MGKIWNWLGEPVLVTNGHLVALYVGAQVFLAAVLLFSGVIA